MADLVTQDYVQNVVPAAGGANPGAPGLASLISAVSGAVERYCRRNFVPNRYREYYDAADQPFLMLRRTPVLALNALTLFPTGSNPISCTPDQFDLRPGIGRISFQPRFTGNFRGLYGPTGWFPNAGLNAVLVDYNAGFGFLTTGTNAIAAGASSVTPAAMSGFFNGQPWAITAGTGLIVDPGQVNQETPMVAASNGASFTATFAAAHAAGCQITGALIPPDIQLAVALAIGNLLNQPDLSKQRESQGKTVGYEYVIRAGELIFTPEIKAILDSYRDVIV